jgi:hypothetical protein
MAFNLHAIAAPFAAIVTGADTAVWRESSGYTTAPGAKRVPAYVDHADTDIRVQALSGDELALVDSLNIQGLKRGVYVSAPVKPIDRASGQGGDLLVFHGATWLVVAELEAWDNSEWCKVAVTKQIDGA